MRNAFKKGDLITAGPTLTIVKGFIGEVLSDSRGDSTMTKVLQIYPGGEAGLVAYKLGATLNLTTSRFVKYTGPDPRIKETKMAAKTNYYQAFMTGIDVRIAIRGEYYDINTEDYADEVGNVHAYNKWSSQDECWLLYVKMNDGEILEVLESELVGYDAPKASSKKAIEVVPVKPVEVRKDYSDVVKSKTTTSFKAPSFNIDSSVMKEQVSKVAF